MMPAAIPLLGRKPIFVELDPSLVRNEFIERHAKPAISPAPRYASTWSALSGPCATNQHNAIYAALRKSFNGLGPNEATTESNEDIAAGLLPGLACQTSRSLVLPSANSLLLGVSRSPATHGLTPLTNTNSTVDPLSVDLSWVLLWYVCQLFRLGKFQDPAPRVMRDGRSHSRENLFHRIATREPRLSDLI
jgi:hypothetical protein